MFFLLVGELVHAVHTCLCSFGAAFSWTASVLGQFVDYAGSLHLDGITPMTAFVVPVLALTSMRERVPVMVVGVGVPHLTRALHVAWACVILGTLASVDIGSSGVITLQEVAPRRDREMNCLDDASIVVCFNSARFGKAFAAKNECHIA